MSDLIHIKTYPNQPEADLAKNLLEVNGIKSMISATDPMRPYLELAMGIRLWVKKADVKKALEIFDKTKTIK